MEMSSDERRKAMSTGRIAVQRQLQPLLVLLVIATALPGAATFACNDSSPDPATVLVCNYLPPDVYVPIASPPKPDNSSDFATLCNSNSSESWQCYYCPYCSPVEAVCVNRSGGELPGRTLTYRIGIRLPLQSQPIGQCTFAEACSEELDIANCSSAPAVQLESISPSSGPASGGTLLTITGAFLTALTEIVVGNSSCDLYSFRKWQTNNTAYCLLTRTQQQAASSSATASVRYSVVGHRKYSFNASTQFTFTRDPKVLDVTPRDVIPSQTRMVVSVDNVASIGAAFLVATSAESNDTLYAPCYVESNSSLSCDCPLRNVYVDDDDDDGVTYDISVYLDGFRNVSFVNGSNSSWALPVTLYQDPVLNTFPSVGLLYVIDPDYGGSDNGATVVITGSGLTNIDSSRYTIEIGNGSSCAITGLDAESLNCTPSSQTPSALGDNYTTYIGQHAPSVVVTIEDTDLVIFIGYVMFYDRQNAYIILGVAFGAMVLAAIILAIALAVHILRERALKRKAGSSYQTKKVSAATTFDAWL